MSERFVYADHAASTKLSPKAIEVIRKLTAEEYFNPSALYGKAERARGILHSSRALLANIIGAEEDEIIFTSGGTESDNMALFGRASVCENGKGHLITTEIEHKAVLMPAKKLRKDGFDVTFLKPDSSGCISPDDVKSAIREDTFLVSVMTANNEIGTIEPIHEIGEICAEKGVAFHTDAVQAVGHLPIDVKKDHITFLSASAHKFGGPKGVGFLYLKKGTPFAPLILGGGQEGGFRSGTENVIGVAAMAAALKEAEEEREKEAVRLEKLTSIIDESVLSLPDVFKTGYLEKRLPGHLSYVIGKTNGEALVHLLDMEGIAASAGSACNAGKEAVSYVLKAIGIPEEKASSSLRISLGRENTEEDARYMAKILPEIIENIRRLS